MLTGKIRHLLNELNQVAEQKLDVEAQQKVQDLNTDIHQLLILDVELPEQELLEEITAQARAIEASFASQHPVAQRLVQEVIYILGQMGV